MGNDYPTPDGTCIRDYVHVSDLAEAHVLTLEHLVAGGESMATNLGLGEGKSVKEVISAIENISGHTIPKRYCARRPGDPPVLIADASRAWRLLQWKPSRTLEQIIGTAWKWMQHNHKEKPPGGCPSPSWKWRL